MCQYQECCSPQPHQKVKTSQFNKLGTNSFLQPIFELAFKNYTQFTSKLYKKKPFTLK